MIEAPESILALMSVGFKLTFYISLLVFSIYTLFISYHWFAYGTNKTTSMISLAIFLIGSIPLFLIMAITL